MDQAAAGGAGGELAVGAHAVHQAAVGLAHILLVLLSGDLVLPLEQSLEVGALLLLGHGIFQLFGGGTLPGREDKGKEIIEELTGRKDVSVNLDPTMLLSSEEWSKLAKRPKQLKNDKRLFWDILFGNEYVAALTKHNMPINEIFKKNLFNNRKSKSTSKQISVQLDLFSYLEESDNTEEVININDGKRLGYVQDVCADLETGRITSIIVPGGTNKLMSLFSSNNDIVIPWDRITCIGEHI